MARVLWVFQRMNMRTVQMYRFSLKTHSDLFPKVVTVDWNIPILAKALAVCYGTIYMCTYTSEFRGTF